MISIPAPSPQPGQPGGNIVSGLKKSPSEWARGHKAVCPQAECKFVRPLMGNDEFVNTNNFSRSLYASPRSCVLTDLRRRTHALPANDFRVKRVGWQGRVPASDRATVWRTRKIATGVRATRRSRPRIYQHHIFDPTTTFRPKNSQS